ncbi:cytochrome P450 [Actinomadura opuntiae]|uniref:cytochrome P450 n=1 Tax=Actinomadura sp. OS1-43 TaxID=604315 RepID=UPI00255A81CD|nr:cytochrome P450 [Actinomadura sp. OS1-43]MDL4815213.1 cytochrome P450 [Actinomadura sp. OS1-43]
MPTSRASVRTDRATRYLTQLRKHTDRLRHHTGPAEWSDAEGTIELPWGRCTLRAGRDELTLHAEAENEERLRRVQDAIAARLRTIGRRDALTVSWTRSAASIVEALTSPAGRADPFPLYAEAHELGPVSAIDDTWFLVPGYAAVDQVLRNPDFGPSPRSSSPSNPDIPSMSRSILWANPPDHGRMRSQLSQVFTPRRVAALRPAIETAVESLLDGLEGDPVDFMDRFAFPLPITVIGEMLGVPPSDRHRFRPLATDLTEALELPALTSRSASAESAARELGEYFTALIRERRAHPRDDLVSALVTARITDDELLANLVLLLVAGFETTTNLLGNGLALLFDHPETASALRSGELPAARFVEEVLRYDSPVQITTRTARTENLTIAGTPIPEGSEVVLLLGAANRDPSRFPDPDRFDPSRRDNKPLSFGAGPHICLGNALARLEATIAFPRLLARYPALSPAAPPTRQNRLTLRGHTALPIHLTRKP